MALRVRFLGSGDAFGSGGRLQTCILLEGPDGNLLIDCGATSLVAMKRAGVDPSEIGWIALSHLHGDHFGGIPFLVLDGQFGRRERPLVIAGPIGVAERVETAMEVLYPGSSKTKRRFELTYVELPDREPTGVGPATVTGREVVHHSGAASLGVRVEYAGTVVAYSGDTEWTDALVELSAGADLFVCEAYFYDKKIKFHLDYQTLIANRGRLTCDRVILTHMSNDMLDRDDVELDRAEDGLVIEL